MKICINLHQTRISQEQVGKVQLTDKLASLLKYKKKYNEIFKKNVDTNYNQKDDQIWSYNSKKKNLENFEKDYRSSTLSYYKFYVQYLYNIGKSLLSN